MRKMQCFCVGRMLEGKEVIPISMLLQPSPE